MSSPAHAHTLVTRSDTGVAVERVCSVCGYSLRHTHVWVPSAVGVSCVICGVPQNPESKMSAGHTHEWSITMTLTGTPALQECTVCGYEVVLPVAAEVPAGMVGSWSESEAVRGSFDSVPERLLDIGDMALNASEAILDLVGALQAGYGDEVSETAIADDAARLIFEVVRNSPDPFKAGGEWMMKFTNGITKIIREEEGGS